MEYIGDAVKPYGISDKMSRLIRKYSPCPVDTELSEHDRVGSHKKTGIVSPKWAVVHTGEINQKKTLKSTYNRFCLLFEVAGQRVAYTRGGLKQLSKLKQVSLPTHIANVDHQYAHCHKPGFGYPHPLQEQN